ncbi:MAG: lysostaphin resistance A-like protein [Aristaeellaceae bacterium]
MTALTTHRSAWLKGRAGRAMLLTLVLMALRVPVGLVLDLAPAEDPAIFYARQCLREALMWGLPALLLRPFRVAGQQARRRCPGPCLAALMLGAAAQLALSPVTALWAAWTGAPLSVLSLPENEAQWLLAALALCIAPALCEEAFFRGGVLTGLTDAASRGTALVLSTLLFTLMHGSLAGLPAQLAISLIAGLCMLRWGRLRVSMLLHLGYNAMALLTPALPVSMGVSAPLLMLLAAAGLWMAGGIAWRGRHRRMGLPEGILCALALVCAALSYLPELV